MRKASCQKKSPEGRLRFSIRENTAQENRTHPPVKERTRGTPLSEKDAEHEKHDA
jgi:hypothetical protein